MIDKAKTLDECFKELILKRGWSKNSPYDRRTASRHKKLFLEGALPDEFKRNIFAKCWLYNSAAGALATGIIKQRK